MPATRRRSTARKSAKTATPVLKESITTVKKSTVTTPKRVNNVTPSEIKKVTETPTETPTPKARRFATTRPEQPNITLEEYISDFKVRMQINNYEVMEFMADVVKFYNNAKPVVIKSVDYVKDSYDRAFNQEEDKKQDQDS